MKNLANPKTKNPENQKINNPKSEIVQKTKLWGASNFSALCVPSPSRPVLLHTMLLNKLRERIPTNPNRQHGAANTPWQPTRNRQQALAANEKSPTALTCQPKKRHSHQQPTNTKSMQNRKTKENQKNLRECLCKLQALLPVAPFSTAFRSCTCAASERESGSEIPAQSGTKWNSWLVIDSSPSIARIFKIIRRI